MTVRGRREACCFRAYRGEAPEPNFFEMNTHTSVVFMKLLALNNLHVDPNAEAFAGIDDDVEGRKFAEPIFLLKGDFKPTPAEGLGNQKLGKLAGTRLTEVDAQQLLADGFGIGDRSHDLECSFQCRIKLIAFNLQ